MTRSRMNWSGSSAGIELGVAGDFHSAAHSCGDERRSFTITPNVPTVTSGIATLIWRCIFPSYFGNEGGSIPCRVERGTCHGTSRQVGTMERATSAAPAARNYFHSLDSYSRRPRVSRLCALGYLRRRSAPVRNGHGQSTGRISTRARARRSARNIMSRCMAPAGPDRAGVYRPCRPEVTRSDPAQGSGAGISDRQSLAAPDGGLAHGGKLSQQVPFSNTLVPFEMNSGRLCTKSDSGQTAPLLWAYDFQSSIC